MVYSQLINVLDIIKTTPISVCFMYSLYSSKLLKVNAMVNVIIEDLVFVAESFVKAFSILNYHLKYDNDMD